MPDIADVAWSEHDERNSEAVPNGWPTGAFPAYTDLVGQMMMGATKRFWNKINPVYQTSGTGDNYVVQTEIGIDQINLYEILCIRIDRSNTTSTPTLQFGATNARTIVKAGASGYVPLAAGDMYAGNSHTFWYNGAFYILVDPALIVGTTVQPYSPNLTSWAAITRATGFDTWVASPTSANLAALVGDETGTGALVFGTGPTLSAPLLAGGTSGTTTLQASANASGTLTFPAATDTLVGRATTDTLTNKTINGSNNTITNVSLTTGVTGTLPIGNGGTGQITAGAAFDALSPTTTRGDLIFRNATTNARLAASTAGYLLQTNGAGADPSWAGFLQAGTSAVTRTWQDKVRERVSVKDFGAVGDGVTDDTAAIQAAETYRASVAGELVFPPGTYQISATNVTVNRAAGGAWRGVGEAMLRASANTTFMCILTGAVAGTTNKPFLISGLHFHGGGFTSCRGVHEVSPYGTTIENCTFTQMAYCASFIGPASATQMGWIQINNIRQYGGGSWAFYSNDNTTYLFHIEMSNIHQVGTGSAANWENDFWIEGRRSVGLSINNCWSGSLDGGASGLRLRGDCQGVFVTNSTFVWAKIGLELLTWTDTLKPSYVYMANIGVDQHTISGAEIEARTLFLTNANFANGYIHTNTGQACLLKSTCTDISLENVLFAYDQKSGLVVQNGATKVRVANYTAENNNQVAGAFYEVDLGASSFTDVRLHGRNIIGAAGVNATGQRLINGVTSPAVSLNNTPASTAANTTATDLMTYSIPANALKVGQRVRVKAWGTTAANANTKTGRLFFGTTNMGGWSGTLNANGWEVNAEIDITGSNTQSYNRNTLGVNTITQNVSGTATEVMTSAIVAKFQGQNGVATAGDITCNGLEVEILD